MLDEIINYVQSLQRQVEVNQDFLEIIEKKIKKMVNFPCNSEWLLIWLSFLCDFVVPFHEVGNCQSKNGLQCGSPYVQGCKYLLRNKKKMPQSQISNPI